MDEFFLYFPCLLDSPGELEVGLDSLRRILFLVAVATFISAVDVEPNPPKEVWFAGTNGFVAAESVAGM